MAVKDWSTTAASNTGILGAGIVLDGSVLNVPLVDDSIREMAAQIAFQLGKIGFKGSDMPSAATVDLATASGWYVDVTGSTAITALGIVSAGQLYVLRFAGTLVLTHNATTLILPGSGNITTAAGDVAWMMSLGGGNWRCVAYNSAAPSFRWLREPGGEVALYNGATRMLYITTAGDLRMKGDIVSDYPGV